MAEAVAREECVKTVRFWTRRTVALALTAIASSGAAAASFMRGGPHAVEVAKKEGEEAGAGKLMLNQHEREIRGLNKAVRVLARGQMETNWNLRADIERHGGHWEPAPPMPELDDGLVDPIPSPASNSGESDGGVKHPP